MADKFKNFEELEAKILQKCKGKPSLFRGTRRRYSKEGETKINSSLYRWAVGENFVFYEKYRPFNMEKEIVERAKKHFPDRTSNIEVLTDLQHYGGKTNLIDFSRNLYKALFFACDGDFEEDGELICLKSSMTMKKYINYAYLENTLSPFIIEPAGTQTSQRRVIAQDSVFVYAPKGFLEQGDLEIIPVPHDLKKDILRHLKEFHNIDTNTIYNDLIGFITNEKNYETAAIHLYKGLSLATKGNHEEAIENYNEAIKLNPDLEAAYFNRGNSKAKSQQYEDAIKDYDRAIKLNPKNADAYNNQGVSRAKSGQYQDAVKDFDAAIKLNPDIAEAYDDRGRSKTKLEQYQDAIKDYNKAIKLNLKYSKAYNISKAELEDRKEAIKNLKKRIQDCKDKLNKR